MPRASIFAALLVLLPATARAEEENPYRLRYLALPFSFGMTSFFETKSLNKAAHAIDPKGVGPLFPSVSGTIVAALRMRLVLAPHYRYAIGSSEHMGVEVHQAFMHLGYHAFERGELVLIPFIGPGIGITSLSIEKPGLPAQPFQDVIVDPRGDASMHSVHAAVHGGLAAHLWGSGHGDFIGLASGVVISPFSAGWKRRGASVLDGPEPLASGAYLMLVAGWHTPKAQRDGPNARPFLW